MGHNSTPAGGCSDKPHTSPSRPLTEKWFPRNWGFSTTTRRTHALAIRSYLVPTALTTPTTRPLHHSTPCSGCFAPARGKIGDIREQHTSDWRTILLQLRQEQTKTDLVLDHAPPLSTCTLTVAAPITRTYALPHASRREHGRELPVVRCEHASPFPKTSRSARQHSAAIACLHARPRPRTYSDRHHHHIHPARRISSDLL